MQRKVHSWREQLAMKAFQSMSSSLLYPVYSVRYATSDEDHAGVDLVVDTPIGECLVQILCSRRSQWIRKHPGFPGIVVILCNVKNKRGRQDYAASNKLPTLITKLNKHLTAWIKKAPPYH